MSMQVFGYRDKSFFVGLSALQIIPVPIITSNGTTTSNGVSLVEGKLIPRTFFTAVVRYY